MNIIKSFNHFLILLLSVIAVSIPTWATEPNQATPLANIESPYFVFQLTRGSEWDIDKTLFEQPLKPHFDYMTLLEQKGVLIYGGPLDRAPGGDALGVIKSTSLEDAVNIMEQDPTIVSGLLKLVSVDRWIASAGSGEHIDKSLVRPKAKK